MMQNGAGDDARQYLRLSRSGLLAIGFFSFVLNVLMLTGPLFMLQVYDRVLTSRSVPTLVALSVLATVLYAISGLLEFVRLRILVRIGLEFDRQASAAVFDASSRMGRLKGQRSLQHLRDYDALRQFVAGPGPATLFDLPWTPIYIGLLFAFHPLLGLTATVGAAVLFTLAVVTDRITQKGLREASPKSRLAAELAEAGHTNAEVLSAMGMLPHYRRRWQGANREALLLQSRSSDAVANLTALSKTLRLMLQSAMLGLGAYLAIKGDVSSGAIVASSIIMGRGLAPVEQAIAQWRGFARAREARRALEALLAGALTAPVQMALPKPSGRIDVRGLRVSPPDSTRIAVNNVSFSVAPGQILAIGGPSASGKSSLVRALIGAWPIQGGEIRFDGARHDQWDPDRLGEYIGYVPQDVELFAGTVRDNVCRFAPDARDTDVIAAAQLANAHAMILALPKGYDTELGAFGSHLSAGQKQRVALARALYGDPVLVILDEPNSNLDGEGDNALLSALDALRQKGKAVIIVTHRSSAIARSDLFLVLEGGQQVVFGPKDEVARKLAAMASAARQPAPGGQAQPTNVTHVFPAGPAAGTTIVPSTGRG